MEDRRPLPKSRPNLRAISETTLNDRKMEKEGAPPEGGAGHPAGWPDPN